MIGLGGTLLVTARQYASLLYDDFMILFKASDSNAMLTIETWFLLHYMRPLYLKARILFCNVILFFYYSSYTINCDTVYVYMWLKTVLELFRFRNHLNSTTGIVTVFPNSHGSFVLSLEYRASDMQWCKVNKIEPLFQIDDFEIKSKIYSFNCLFSLIHILNCKISLFFGFCFFLYFLKFSTIDFKIKYRYLFT